MGDLEFTQAIVDEVQRMGQCLNVLYTQPKATTTGDPGYAALIYAYYSRDTRLYRREVSRELNGWTEGL